MDSQVLQTPGDPSAEVPEITVFYDGACPLCAREIGFYRRRRGAERIRWLDVSQPGRGEVAPGLSREQALARFHLLDGEGRLLSGGAAFARLWEALPAFRLFGQLGRTRPAAWALERAYDLFLPIRPRLQAWLMRDAACGRAALPAWLIRDLRSDHAGETGAVAIYRGILALTRDSEVWAFAAKHLRTEREHLDLIETLLPRRNRSLLLPLWRIAGFLTGALPALFGRDAVFATIAAVETFVDRHYAAQTERLAREDRLPEIRAILERCRADEVRHRNEASTALEHAPGVLVRSWCQLVGAGSAAAVALARRV